MELWAITPELTLATGFLVLLAWAPFVDPRNSFRIYLTALAILAVATILTLRMPPWPNRAVFHGTYVVDPLSHFMKLYAIVATVLALPACAAYFSASTFRSDIPALLVAAALGAAMMAGSADLSLIILFFYIVTISTLILVGIVKEDDRGNEAALKYFLYGAAATAIMLYGLSFLYGLSGTTSLVSAAPEAKEMLAFALMLALVGFGFKMAMVPFHMWAPDVYEGSPTPVAGYLAVLPKAAAIIIVLRLLHTAFSSIAGSWQLLFGIVAGLTMTLGNILAFRQNNIKRLLAYSSIAQIGYILAGLAMSASQPEGAQAVLFYLVSYLFMNLGAFLIVARLESSFEAAEIRKYAGLYRRAPVLTLCFTVFLLSLAGIPPLSGYVGKVLIFVPLVSQLPWLAIVMGINVVMSAYYYLRVIAMMYLEKPPEDFVEPFIGAMDVPIAGCLMTTVVLGIAPDPVITWLRRLWPLQ